MAPHELLQTSPTEVVQDESGLSLAGRSLVKPWPRCAYSPEPCSRSDWDSALLVAALAWFLLPPGSIAGRTGNYDYSPTSYYPGICSNLVVWGSYNPNNSTQYSDTIQYESIDLSTQVRYGPVAVLVKPRALGTPYTPATRRSWEDLSPIRSAMGRVFPMPCTTSDLAHGQ